MALNVEPLMEKWQTKYKSMFWLAEDLHEEGVAWLLAVDVLLSGGYTAAHHCMELSLEGGARRP